MESPRSCARPCRSTKGSRWTCISPAVLQRPPRSPTRWERWWRAACRNWHRKGNSGRSHAMRKLVIDPVTRIEGHAKIDIYLDDAGHVTDTHFHVTQVRGFEKFTEGRPYYEMPSITARIYGICPVSHLLASAKACDAIMAVAPPPAAVKLRELIHCAQFVQSHALSFFHLSAPDLLLGFDSDPAHRNIFGLIDENPEMAR